jgi:hypothetical protein
MIDDYHWKKEALGAKNLVLKERLFECSCTVLFFYILKEPKSK